MSGLEINILVISDTSLSPLHKGKNWAYKTSSMCVWFSGQQK